MKIPKLEKASKIFIDTAPLIYWIEENPTYTPLLQPLFQEIENGEKSGISSFVTLLEVLVKPLRIGRKDLVRKYTELLLQNQYFTLLAIEEKVAEEAARIRAKHEKIRTPDAIQLAIARLENADVFLTNDNKMKNIVGIEIVSLKHYVNA